VDRVVTRPGRRTQKQRSDTTRAALVGAARELFARQGFHATPAERVVRRAAVTSGALYHHFSGKRDLFRAAFDAVEAAVAARVRAAALGGAEPWDRLERGVAEYLRACREPEVRQIVLIDGPSVLGWDAWRAADAEHHLRPVAAALASAMRAGLMARRPALPLARLLMGALTEAGLAAADEESGAAEEATLWLLRRLRSDRPERPGLAALPGCPPG
jgi:AcrR family transcriptional regulator